MRHTAVNRSWPAWPILALVAAACAAPTKPSPVTAAPCAAVPETDALHDTPKPSPASVTRFDSAPWLADLEALIGELSSHYANLDYAVTVRRMNLAALKHRAETRIRSAKSEDDAKHAIRSFLNAFGDAHLGIEWKGAASSHGDPPKEGPLCTRLGYEALDFGGVDFSQLPGFTPIDDADARDVPGGILELPHHRKLGTLRIHVFMEKAHPELCEEARASLGLADDAACDEACADRLEMAVANRLTEALERRARSLAKAGAAVLAVDLTGNGGGSSWVDPAIRVLTPAHVRAEHMGAVRHPHWDKELRSRLHDLEAELTAHGDLPHGEIAAAIASLHEEIAEVDEPCDVSALWQDAATKPSCSRIVPIAPALDYASPGSLEGRSALGVLFGPLQYRYHEGVNTLPLAVLVDDWTASAAEAFAEALQDERAATVLGVRTLGAGCGFTNGGIPTTLPHSGARVRIPDCIRIRADGSDAVAGVTPDVPLPLLIRDSPYQRAQKVIAGVDHAWPSLVSRRVLRN